jgi:DNA-binding response OmpR family regulator
MNRIALVEDHERMASLICKAFSAAGIEVEVFDRISTARAAAEQIAYSALVVDRGLPDGDGLDLLRQLRSRGILTPCLMLTSRDALHDRIDGLQQGADDYLAKPFSMDELIARVQALLRRPLTLRSLTPEFAGLQILPEQGCMRCGEETISLAPAELQLMLSLVRAEGRTLRRTALEVAGWGLGDAVTPNALDVALHRLRKKLAAINSTLQISNLRGQGYALKELGDDAA